MKKRIILFAVMFTTAFAVVAQGIPVRFTARNANGAYHPFDSVRIENLSRGWIYSLAYPDTSIVLGSGSSEGIDRVVGNGELELKVYPNPFAGHTEAMLQLTEGGNVNMRIIRIDGTVISYYSGNLSAGEYRIGISMAKPQVAFLCIETGGQRHVAKLVNGTTGSADRIEVALIGGPKPQTKDDDQYDYEDGDTMRYTAILVANCTNIESESITEENVSDTTVILVFDDDYVVLPATEGFYENGSSHALFSVSADRKVRFSRGNLQYQASTDTWRFAEHQYEYIDSCNENISESYSGWIDLFGWGTSGWNSGAAAYQPWATSENNEDYVPNGNSDNDLTGDYANADWGVYNAVSNGGDQPGMWRTLTYDEMMYLIESRPNAVNKLGSATVNGMPGLVILPDDWTLPAGLTFTSDMVTNSFESNIYSAEQWTAMENAGALFLPAAGFRVGTELFENPDWIPIEGGYWTSTHTNMHYVPGAYSLWITGNSVHCYNTRSDRRTGTSVRLIMDYSPAEPAVSTREVTGITKSFAIGGGNITFSGGEEVIARGVCWSTEHNPTIEDSHTSDGTGLGDFTSHLTDLTPSTTYYVRAYATNSVGTAYGHEMAFTTPGEYDLTLPAIITLLSNIESISAIGGGIVVEDGGSPVTVRGVCWSTFPNPTLEDSHTSDGTGTGVFVSNLNGLEPSTTYHVRAYATNSVGTSYGEDIIFTTACAILGGFDENGASNALFSVAEDRQVHFSKGNLQYQASSSTWRFAEHQYDFIGSSNSNVSSTYTGWIDLFGWGTSGWNGSGATYYQPYSTSTLNSGYGPGTNDLVGVYAEADWGVYNSISNGGNQPGMWRTLTNEEWAYLLEGREDAENKICAATVNGVAGLIVLPDFWETPDGLTFTAEINGYSRISYTAAQWEQMENNGALFLPAANCRYGQSIDTDSDGNYWSSSASSGGSYGAYYLFFYDTGLRYYDGYRSSGFSVRLVMN